MTELAGTASLGAFGSLNDLLTDYDPQRGPSSHYACAQTGACGNRGEVSAEQALSETLIVGTVVGVGVLTPELLASRAAINPKIYAQLEKQLAQAGSRSIRQALRSAEKTLAEHQAKLERILREGGYPSQVQTTIRNVRSQIETLKKFIKDYEL